MKLQMYVTYTILLILALLGNHSNASECQVNVVANGKTCDTLKPSIDLKGCDSEGSHDLNVTNCSGTQFTASNVVANKEYNINVSGSAWGGQSTWEVASAKVTTRDIEPPKENKKKKAKREAKKQPKKTPASVAVVATPVAAPQPAPIVIAKAETPEPAKESSAVEAANKLINSEFVKNTKFFGDFRWRNESTTEKTNSTGNATGYSRDRIRARFGAKTDANENLKFELRLASGTGGTTTNQTLGSSGDGKNYVFNLDRAYLTLYDNDFGEINLGRMAQQFNDPGKTGLVFDSDFNPDGINANTTQTFGNFQAQLDVGHYILDETQSSTTEHDVKFYDWNLGLKYNFTESLSLLLTGGILKFEGTNGHSVIASFGGNSNNGTNYIYDYTVTSLGTEVSGKFGLPLTFYAEFIKNDKAPAQNEGYVTGLKAGSSKKSGDLQGKVEYRRLEKDATINGLVDGDAFGGGGNALGMRYNFSYMVYDDLKFNTSYMDGKTNIAPGDSSEDFTILQVEIIFNF